MVGSRAASGVPPNGLNWNCWLNGSTQTLLPFLGSFTFQTTEKVAVGVLVVTASGGAASAPSHGSAPISSTSRKPNPSPLSHRRGVPPSSTRSSTCTRRPDYRPNPLPLHVAGPSCLGDNRFPRLV